MAQTSTPMHRLGTLVASLALAGCGSGSSARPVTAAGASPRATAEPTFAEPLAAAYPNGGQTATRCVDDLLAHDVAFMPLRYSRGVAIPVQIAGPVAGVRYQPTAGFNLVIDCRFALVLAAAGPILRRHGISTIEFSIAHAYRPTRGGQLSLHANGLALDIHGAVFEDGAEQSVQQDFSRRLGSRGCSNGSKPMNQLACELKHTGWFSEFLTPDDNRDHADHFHLGIPRVPGSFTPSP